MRTVLLLLFIGVAATGVAMPAAVPPPGAAQFATERRSVESPLRGHRGVAPWIADRTLAKVAVLLRKAPAREEVLATIGLFLGILGGAAWIFASYLGVVLAIPLGLVGLTLSLLGLRAARRRGGTTRSVRLAIAGIVVNSLVLLTFFVLAAIVMGG